MPPQQQNRKTNFADALHALLDKHGVPASQQGRLKAVTQLTGRSRSTVHRWLSGTTLPDVDDQFSLCEILKCSLDELLGRFPVTREILDENPTSRLKYFSEHGTVDIEVPALFFPQLENDNALAVIRVSNHEASGYAELNDRIFFDLSDRAVRSGAVYILKIANRLVVRRLFVRIDSRIEIRCFNDSFPSEVFDQSAIGVDGTETPEVPITVLGRVIAKLNFSRD
jgi:transcriptional regulator with XRE-family HTH domain